MTTATALDVRTTLLAVELARHGGRFVVVGSTARRLLDRESPRPRDLDVVVSPTEVPALVAALRSLGAHTTETALARGVPTRVATGWCPVDVFVRPLLPPAARVVVAGTSLAVCGTAA